MHVGKFGFQDCSVPAGGSDRVTVAMALQSGVAAPSVGVDLTTSFYAVAEESLQALCRGVRHVPHADPAELVSIEFHSYDDQALLHQLPSADSLLRAAHVRLVHFYSPCQGLPSDPDHRRAQLVQHEPRGSIASKSELSLQARRTQAGLLSAAQPHREKPASQRDSRPVHRGSRCRRSLLLAGCAEHMAAIGQPGESGAAMRANESIGPPSTCQVRSARLFGGELLGELKKVPRESCDRILHGMDVPQFRGYSHFTRLKCIARSTGYAPRATRHSPRPSARLLTAGRTPNAPRPLLHFIVEWA